MIREITYVLMDPAHNYTILAETAVPEELQPDAAARLMEREPLAEQVGFLTTRGDMPALRMAGGEFCGNAAMSAAVRQAEKAGIPEGTTALWVSGAKQPVSVSVKQKGEHLWAASVTMPEAGDVVMTDLPGGYRLPVVPFGGIAHVILEDPSSKGRAEELAKQWCAFLHRDAVGLMYYNAPEAKLDPLVYVPGADTMCWESACGSGSSAVGVYLAQRCGKPVTAVLKQPGGVLEVKADPAGSVILSGTVKQVYQKTVGIDL